MNFIPYAYYFIIKLLNVNCHKCTEIRFTKIINNFKKMCLFTDNIDDNCFHSECQIVLTIKNINSNIFDRRSKSMHSI